MSVAPLVAPYEIPLSRSDSDTFTHSFTLLNDDGTAFPFANFAVQYRLTRECGAIVLDLTEGAGVSIAAPLVTINSGAAVEAGEYVQFLRIVHRTTGYSETVAAGPVLVGAGGWGAAGAGVSGLSGGFVPRVRKRSPTPVRLRFVPGLVAAEAKAAEAAASASTATTQAGIATTKAAQAATSESNSATNAATATTQAGIATTKAGEAATSATNAAISESNAAATLASAVKGYDTLTAALAASVPAGTGVLEVAGRATIDDGGKGKLAVYANSAAVPAGAPAASTFTLADATRKARYIKDWLNPADFGIYPGAGFSNEQGLIDMGADFVWSGGRKRIEFPDGKDIQFFATNPAAGTYPLLNVSGTKGGRINFNGCRLYSPANFGIGVTAYLLYGTGTAGAPIDDLAVDGLCWEQTGYAFASTTKGVYGAPLDGIVRGAQFLDCRAIAGGLLGVQIARGASYSTAERARHFNITGDFNKVGYGVVAARNGDDFNADIRCFGTERDIFVQNITKFDVRTRTGRAGTIDSGSAADCVLLKVYADSAAAQPFENRLTNGKVKVVWEGHRDTSNHPALVALQFQQLTATTAAGVIEDIEIDVYGEANGFYPSQGIYTSKITAAFAADITQRGYVMRDISAKIDLGASPTAGKFVDFFNTTANGTFTGTDVVENIEVLALARGTGSVDFNMGQVTHGFARASGRGFGNLNIGTPTLGVADLSRGVDFANVKSASAASLTGTSGQTGYKRLPDGMIEQFGFISVPDASAGAQSADFTFPVAFRAGGYQPVITATPNSANSGDFYVGFLSTTQGRITRPSGAGACLFYWRAVGLI